MINEQMVVRFNETFLKLFIRKIIDCLTKDQLFNIKQIPYNRYSEKFGLYMLFIYYIQAYNLIDSYNIATSILQLDNSKC